MLGVGKTLEKVASRDCKGFTILIDKRAAAFQYIYKSIIFCLVVI
jgi:hypothetical protein